MALGIWMLGILGAIIILFFYLPVRFRFSVEYQTDWVVTVKARFFVWEFSLIEGRPAWLNGLEQKAQQALSVQQDKASGGAVLEVLTLARQHILPMIERSVHLQYFVLKCRVGYHRADYTAYSCGLFWAVVSMLPKKWLKNSALSYLPDFQTAGTELQIQGIIRCRMVHLIGIWLKLCRIIVQMQLEQNRKEQGCYEN